MPFESLALEVEAPLVAAAAAVLQTMFFVSVEGLEGGTEGATGDAGSGAAAATEGFAEAEDEPMAAAEVRFHGAHSGRFRLVLPESSARILAANFSGILDAGQVSAQHTREVLGEFANMVCGATLSRLAPQAVFKLETPRWPGAENNGRPPVRGAMDGDASRLRGVTDGGSSRLHGGAADEDSRLRGAMDRDTSRLYGAATDEDSPVRGAIDRDTSRLHGAATDEDSPVRGAMGAEASRLRGAATDEDLRLPGAIGESAPPLYGATDQAQPAPHGRADPDTGGCTAALARRLITDTGWMDLYWCWEEPV